LQIFRFFAFYVFTLIYHVKDHFDFFWVCSLKGYIFINVLLQHQKRIIFYHTIIAQSKVEQWNINVLKFINLYERRERQKMCSLIRKDIMTRINGKIYFFDMSYKIEVSSNTSICNSSRRHIKFISWILRNFFKCLNCV
jgi:hypothetical protein